MCMMIWGRWRRETARGGRVGRGRAQLTVARTRVDDGGALGGDDGAQVPHHAAVPFLVDDASSDTQRSGQFRLGHGQGERE